MKIRNFFYTLLSWNNLAKEIHHEIKNENNFLLLQILNRASTPYLISKTLKNKENKHEMYQSLSLLIRKGDVENVKKLIDIGLKTNIYQKELFDNLLRIPKEIEYQKPKIFQLLLDSGFDINDTSENVSAVNTLISSFKHSKVNLKIDNKMWCSHLEKKEDAELIKLSYNYELFQMMLQKGIQLNTQENLIYLGLKAESLVILKDLLTINGMNIDYIQKGSNEAQEKLILNEELLKELSPIYEKFNIEKVLQKPIENKVSKKQKI